MKRLYTAFIYEGDGAYPKMIENILAKSTVDVYKKLPKVTKVRQIITVEESGKIIDLTK